MTRHDTRRGASLPGRPAAFAAVGKPAGDLRPALRPRARAQAQSGVRTAAARCAHGRARTRYARKQGSAARPGRRRGEWRQHGSKGGTHAEDAMPGKPDGLAPPLPNRRVAIGSPHGGHDRTGHAMTQGAGPPCPAGRLAGRRFSRPPGAVRAAPRPRARAQAQSGAPPRNARGRARTRYARKQGSAARPGRRRAHGANKARKEGSMPKMRCRGSRAERCHRYRTGGWL